ncbi:hypothetical protein [Legionella sp. WA2022007384]
MKNLKFEERVELLKLAQESITYKNDNKKLEEIKFKALKLIHDKPEEIDNWNKSSSEEDTKKLNKLVDELYDYFDKLLMAKSKILSAGTNLISNFDEAELDAKEAIRLASGNPKQYDEYEKNVANYFASDEAKDINQRKKKGEQIDHPKNILDQQQFIKDAKNIVNTLANSLMVSSPEFRKNRVNFIKQTLEGPEYQAEFVARDGQMQFRTIRPDGDYGKPAVAFKEGLAPQFVSVWAFQTGVISKPYVNDVYKTTGEKVGWSGGITSTSANIKFCAAFDFAATYGIQNGLIYVYSCDEAASIARHISFGVGYDGKVRQTQGVERSNAEAAMEYMLPYLAPERIVGAREIKEDGSLGAYFPNPNVKFSAYGDTEYLKLMLCNSVDEIKLVEYLERRSVEVIHHDEDIEYTNKMVVLFRTLPVERQTVILKLAHSSLIALNNELTQNLDPNLKETDPQKWELLQNLNCPGNLQNSIEVLPIALQEALSMEQHKELSKGLEKDKKMFDVKSHFPFQFEREKRSTKESRPEPVVYFPRRFFRDKLGTVCQDELEEVGKITPTTLTKRK